jgi:hypothetical protein
MINKTTELCPHCGWETELEDIFKVQICNECRSEIYPCSICEYCTCDNCPLEKGEWMSEYIYGKDSDR